MFPRERRTLTESVCVCVCLQSLNTPLYVLAKTACERHANENYMEPSRHTLYEFMGVSPRGIGLINRLFVKGIFTKQTRNPD